MTAAAEMVRFELQMLAELGFGLDLASLRRDRRRGRSGLCVAEVRPRGVARGRRALAGPAVPACRRFCRRRVTPSLDDIADGFALTGFFLVRHVLEPRGLAFADAREGFVAAVLGRRLPARVAQ